MAEGHLHATLFTSLDCRNIINTHPNFQSLLISVDFMAQLFSPCQRRANGVNRVQNIFTIDVFVCGEEQRRRQGDVTRGRLGSALFAAEFSVDLPEVDAPYYWIRSNSQPAGWTLQLRAEWARKAGRAGVALLSLSCSPEIGTFFSSFFARKHTRPIWWREAVLGW